MIEVKVPATSANVGPGFDCMGIAMSIYGVYRFSVIDEGLIVSGCPKEWQNEQNLVYQSCKRVFDDLQIPMLPLHIDIQADAIPLARGLGSSAACIVAGVMGANALCGYRLSKAEMLTICSELEGHPDNVAPAIYGGLTISFQEGNKVLMTPCQVDKKFKFCAMIPDYPVLTEAARSVLPDSLPISDAVYNIGRSASLALALSSGNSEMVAHACSDRLHQPYRKKLIVDYEMVGELCKQHGVLTWYISGSGSTMMAISDNDNVLASLKQDVCDRFPGWQVHCVAADENGAQVLETCHG